MDNELRILVSTDNHLGYLERDHIRGEDSFRAFEEVFELAYRHQADCVLLAGDLFHEVHPSKHTMYRAVSILQKYCVGDRPVSIACVDNQNFRGLDRNTKLPNYYSENLNVALPVFSIHGNHDEPSGHKGVASLDILAEAGLVNYFGRMESLNGQVTVAPVTLQKNGSAANLYGIGALRDERLAKMFAEGRIVFEKSEKGANILVLHQTRCGTSASAYLPEELLSPEMNLVVWGHMHLSEPAPKPNPKMGFSTIQPGSTVQTSLCQAESKDKHCVLLTVVGDSWSCATLPMQSTRKFVFKTLTVGAGEVERRIKEEMARIIGAHREALAPLVRLRLEIDGDEPAQIIPRRVLEEFRDQVANPKEVLRLVRRRRAKAEASSPGEKPSKAQFSLPALPTKILTDGVFAQSILECIDKEDKAVLFTRYEEVVAEIVAVLRSHRWTNIDTELALAVKEVERKYARTTVRKIEPDSPAKKLRPELPTENQPAEANQVRQPDQKDQPGQDGQPGQPVQEDYAFASLWN